MGVAELQSVQLTCISCRKSFVRSCLSRWLLHGRCASLLLIAIANEPSSASGLLGSGVDLSPVTVLNERTAMKVESVKVEQNDERNTLAAGLSTFGDASGGLTILFDHEAKLSNGRYGISGAALDLHSFVLRPYGSYPLPGSGRTEISIDAAQVRSRDRVDVKTFETLASWVVFEREDVGCLDLGFLFRREAINPDHFPAIKDQSSSLEIAYGWSTDYEPKPHCARPWQLGTSSVDYFRVAYLQPINEASRAVRIEAMHSRSIGEGAQHTFAINGQWASHRVPMSLQYRVDRMEPFARGYGLSALRANSGFSVAEEFRCSTSSLGPTVLALNLAPYASVDYSWSENPVGRESKIMSISIGSYFTVFDSFSGQLQFAHPVLRDAARAANPLEILIIVRADLG